MKKSAYVDNSGNSSLSLAVLACAGIILIQNPVKAYAFDSPQPLEGASFSIAPASHSQAEMHTNLLLVSETSTSVNAEKFIDSMATRGLSFLGDSSLSQEQKKAAFRNLLNDSFDLDTIGRFVLGRHWKTSTTQQRQEYLALFRKMVVEVYAKRFSDYKGQKFETRGHRADNDKDTIVTSFIVSDNGPEVQVDWRVRYKNGQYKIVDVIVEGVSMSMTQRSDFASVIQRGGGDVQVLLAHLRTSTGNNNSQQ